MLNNPYPAAEAKANIYYSSFSERPKTLDPARAYSQNEYVFLAQIYEPPVQYHYLLRPYRLIPLSATELPKAVYYDQYHKVLPENVPGSQVAYTLYTIHIKPGMYYQPHPALARDSQGKYFYHQITLDFLHRNRIRTLQDFPQQGTREVVADDFVYEIKRLANPSVQSPILGVMGEHIIGLNELATELQKVANEKDFQIKKRQEIDPFIDLRHYLLKGVKVLDRYTYQIQIKGKYPQFVYWLALPFFAPIPWEADWFDSQSGMQAHNLTLDWYPLGSGPYLLAQNNPNRRMRLRRNPNFHGELYPTEGMPEDYQHGLLQYAGQPLPFLDQIEFVLEKESIPRWAKFLQGYYDSSGISSDSFDQAIRVDEKGQIALTKELTDKKIRLEKSVQPSIYYLGFNMKDEIVGGKSEHARKLRLALSIAINYEEYIAIFLNGRGILAQSPIPPSIFGHRDGPEGVDPYIYKWQANKLIRHPMEMAYQLMKEAGYPEGRDPKTNKPLILHYDTPASGGPDDKALFDWLRKQFAKVGIQLDIRATQYNRFQQKMRDGHAQIFSWGWHADYPDPENFLFLLYGPNGKAQHNGENATNYSNAQYDQWFERMRAMPDNPAREKIINQMVTLLWHDAPWVWGFYPQTYVLNQTWDGITKPLTIGSNDLKYLKIDPVLRAQLRTEWNQAIIWPIFLILLLLFVSAIPVGVRYWQQEHHPKKRI